MMHSLTIYPYRNTIITPKMELRIACDITLQDTEGISDSVFVISNGIKNIDDVTFCFVSLPH